MKVKILTEKELRQAVGVNLEAVAAIEAGFSALADNRAAMPPIMHIEVPEHQGDVDIKAAYVEGLDHMAGKWRRLSRCPSSQPILYGNL